MTPEAKTSDALISRRTILRTSANAAWLVPAISLATAVPAMAACSTETARKFTVSQGSKGSTGTLLNPSYTQKVTVKSEAAAGSVTLRVTPVKDNILASLKSYNVTGLSGWSQVGSHGNNKSYYDFTRTFACDEEFASDVAVKYGALGALTGSPTVVTSLIY